LASVQDLSESRNLPSLDLPVEGPRQSGIKIEIDVAQDVIFANHRPDLIDET
jgi:hypothetical protein